MQSSVGSSAEFGGKKVVQSLVGGSATPHKTLQEYSAFWGLDQFLSFEVPPFLNSQFPFPKF